MKLIAISGGIGSGKSVVARMLGAMGYPVYDCDSRAKGIMEADEIIRRRIAEEVSEEAICGQHIDRRRLAEIVFSDAQALGRLNSIVHGAVRDDIEEWSKAHETAFVETAILYESGLDRMVDEVWEVKAPALLRLRRAMERDNATEEAVRSRIAAQQSHKPEKNHACVKEIMNDGVVPLLPQLLTLLKEV